MKDRPRFRSSLAQALLSAVMAASALAGCGQDPAVSSGEPDATGALTGTIQSYVADFPDGTSERQRYLDVGEPVNRSLHLTFSSEPELASGDRVRVWGASRGDELVVSQFEKVPPGVEELAVVRALTSVSPKMQKNAFVLIDLGGGINISNATATANVFSPGNNFANVYNTLSYGSMLYTGEVLGPFSYKMSGCDYSGVRTAMRQMITTGSYDHYMWYFGSMAASCAWSGLGAEGTATKPASDSWFNASSSCTVLVQEVGHNNGWMHSSTLNCGGKTFVDQPATSCTTSEYGNRYTPMGQGCGHFVAMDKWYGGYFGGCNGVKVTSSGTFNLLPIETACDGIQGLQIAMPKTTRTFKAQQDTSAYPIKNYYLELRVNGTAGESTSIKAPTVFVNVGNDIGASTKMSYHSFLLDMNPSTANTFDGMTAAGQSFSDPAGGLTFTVMSLDATHASIQVTYDTPSGAAPVCMDGTMLDGSGPLDCGSGAGTGAGGSAGMPATGTAGMTGSSGSAGTTGHGGTGGATGHAGSGGPVLTGSGGHGGSGTAGTTGTTGTTGPDESGSAGTFGIAGTIGSGTAGHVGSAGTAGIMPGITGTAGTNGPSAPGQIPSPVVGGCACETTPQSPGQPVAPMFLLGATVLLARRRRR